MREGTEMVLVNYTTRELTAKLVYYGPGLCGKTTNLHYIFENLLPPDRRGKMLSLNTETDRTLFFDFLPLELGTIRGLKTRLQLYTVPGQVHYNATRKIVLKGADGIVFVADSQETKREGNIESYKNMKQNLAEHGLDLRNVPFVLQFNKRDLPGAMPIDQMVADLNEYNVPFWEAVACDGIGVEDTLKGMVRLVMKNLAGRFQAEGKEAPSAVPVAAPPVPEALPAPVAAMAPPPAPVFTPPPAPTWQVPAAAAPLELSLDPDSASEVLELREDQYLSHEQEAPLDVGGAFDAALASGDTIIAPALGEPPEPAGLPELGFAWPQQVAPDLEAALLAGDTVMSEIPMPGLLTEMPRAAPAPMATPAFEPPAPDFPPTTPPPAQPWALESQADPLGSSVGELEDALLGGAGPFGGEGGGDLESALMSGPPSGPPVLAPPEAAIPLAAPAFEEAPVYEAEFEPEFEMSEPELVPAPVAAPTITPAPPLEAAAEIEAPIQLGRVETGEMVRRIIRLPVEFEDASGRRRTTLTVRLEFRVD